LHRFDEGEDHLYLRGFLNSAMILDFHRWQADSHLNFSLQEQSQLRHKILHVLREHFTGIRLPEETTSQSYLYITLSRRAGEVRQSAQVVLARIPEDSFRLQFLTNRDTVGNIAQQLAMKCEIGEASPELHLGLPFLDYVMMRNQGEIGQDLQVSYMDRLERFRSQITKAAAKQPGDGMMLVRLRTDFTFRKQVITVRKGKLEVTD